jgi:TonB family protein
VGQGLTPAVPAAPRAAPAAPAGEGEATARRVVAGASLMGPVADRPIRRYAAPAYPDWAKSDGVEAAVTLYFVVRADGSVRENVLVQKTAGFEDFDENARVALRAWRFEPLHGGRTGDQWGTITFHFRLRS